MNTDDLNKCKQIIIDNFRWIKLEKDYAQFQLILFQLSQLISYYEQLIELQKEIKVIYAEVVEKLEINKVIDDYDYINWNEKRNDELSSWIDDLNLLCKYKNHINRILLDIENGSAEKALRKEEEKLFS